MNEITITRSHTIACGHTVTGHEGHCKHLHGHTYTFEITLSASLLDNVGRVMDFSVMKELFVNWLEANLDHKFLVFEDDPRCQGLKALDPEGVLICKFNPTVENIASHVAWRFRQVLGTHPGASFAGVRLVNLRVYETPKCWTDITPPATL